MELIIIIINQVTMDKLIFLLAALIKSLPENKIQIIPATPAWLGDHENLKKEIGEILKSLNYSPDTPVNLNLYLLDIGPENFSDDQYLLTFARQHQGLIKLWVARGFDEETANSILSYGARLVAANQDESLIATLRRSGISVWKYLEKAENILLCNEEEAIKDNEIVYRYTQALSVVKVMNKNYGEDETLQLLASMCLEITSGRKQPYVNSLIETWEKMEEYTNQAKEAFTDNFYLFERTKAVGRPIGYARLGEAPKYIDTASILKKALKKFPDLAIVRYNIDDEEFIEFSSLKFDVSKKTRQYQGLNNSDLLWSLKQTVLSYKEPLIN